MIARRVRAGVWCFLAAMCCANAEPLRVTASRQVKIVVVDADKIVFGRELEQVFAAQLCAVLGGASDENGAPQLETLGAREAAQRLKSGACDAVLFLGAERPGVLRAVEGATLAGLCGRVFASTPVYLILPTRDPALRKMLTEAFAAAVGEMPRRARSTAGQ